MIEVMTATELAGETVRWSEMRGIDATDASLLLVAHAVIAYVSTLPISDVPTMKDQMELGMVMLANRLYRRRNSPGGTVEITDVGANYITRNDPDLVMLFALASPLVVG